MQEGTGEGADAENAAAGAGKRTGEGRERRRRKIGIAVQKNYPEEVLNVVPVLKARREKELKCGAGTGGSAEEIVECNGRK